ncbi:MAG: hypothetical protein H6716_23665 [Polyangiaceae bacterium]|nr:hypothetical protein [Polyangiaceae bacterium]
MRTRLESLFWTGALVEVKAGGGKRVTVANRDALVEWIGSHYPSGLDGHEPGLPPRAAAVADFRNSKAGQPLAARPVFMRGFRGAVLHRANGVFPLAELTAAHRLAGVLVEAATPWQVAGVLGLVENFELFMHAETVLPGLDAVLWTAGRLSQNRLDWLAAMPEVQIVHLGDYDPVGLDEYMRVRAAMPRGRARLFVPDDFEERLVRFGQSDLLVASSAVLQRVRATAPRDVRAVLNIMDRHGKALEQEGLLIPLG